MTSRGLSLTGPRGGGGTALSLEKSRPLSQVTASRTQQGSKHPILTRQFGAKATTFCGFGACLRGRVLGDSRLVITVPGLSSSSEQLCSHRTWFLVNRNPRALRAVSPGAYSASYHPGTRRICELVCPPRVPQASSELHLWARHYSTFWGHRVLQKRHKSLPKRRSRSKGKKLTDGDEIMSEGVS